MKFRGIIKVLLILLVLSISQTIVAQTISVASFKFLENDLTANTAGTMERDQNGEPAALIKVVTTQQGFVFDGGMVGIVKTKQGVGEVWVYVPHGIKKMTIQHPQLGVLRDYYFPIAIDKAKTYEMVLSTGRVETVVTHAVNKQFVVFKVNPTNAIVELNDEMLTVDSEGYATKGVEYGTYNYRVSCANYHTEAGQVNVNADGKAEVEVTLRPNFGWIRFGGDAALNGADVYIDNERAGKLPFVSENLKSGVHKVKIVKNMYKTYEQQVTVNDNETTELNVEMIPNFATVTLTTDAESEIWVDGVRRNTGKWTGPLELGNYTIEVRKESHRTVSEILRVEDIGEQTIELKSPTPIYASLEISSTPLRATVFIDGKEVGETPLIQKDVLVGNRRVAFRKDGYVSVDKTVEVKENIENSISATLSKVQSEVSVSKPAANLVSTPIKNSTPHPSKVKTPRKAAPNKKKHTSKIVSIKDSIDNAYKKEIQTIIRLYRKRNYADAFVEFMRYAEQNNYYAQYYLGEMFYHGKGVSVDYVKAVMWYKKAAGQGYSDAQYKLAYCYEKGRGVSKSRKHALNWYRKAAEGNGRASYKAEIF